MAINRIKIDLTEKPSPRSAIFNVLDQVALSGGSTQDMDFTSLSRITNSDLGVCPKCKKPMGTAIIANSDTVFYCEADRVSLPLPDKE